MDTDTALFQPSLLKAPCYPPLATSPYSSLKLFPPAYRTPRSLALDVCTVRNLHSRSSSMIAQSCLRRRTQSADREPRMVPLTSYDLKHTRFSCHHQSTPRSAVVHHHTVQTHVCLWGELLLLLEHFCWLVWARRGPFAITVFVQALLLASVLRTGKSLRLGKTVSVQ